MPDRADRADHVQDPVQREVHGHPLLLDRASGDSRRFISPTARVSRSDRGSAIVGGLIALFLAIAIAKPWSAPVGEPRLRLAALGAASTGPQPSATPDLSDLRRHCQDPLGWRVYSRQAWNDQTLRVWRTVEPATGAAGPLDPGIPLVPLEPRIEALGYCSPWTGQERPAVDATVEAWRLLPERRGGDAYVTVALRSVAPAERTSLGALFGSIVEPEPSAAPGMGWPPGTYVFAIRSPGWQRWWAVDVAEPNPQRTPTPAPSGPPGVDPPVVPTSAPAPST